MKITEKTQEQIKILYLEGNLIGEDLACLTNKLDEFNKAGSKNVIIDLNKVNLMDSFGIEIIDKAISKGLNINLANFPNKLLNYFYQAKITQEINIYSTEEAAIHALSNGLSDKSNISRDRRIAPRIPTKLPASIVIKTDENDIIFGNAFTKNLSPDGAWLEYSDVSEVYDFKALFTMGLKDKNILELFLDVSKNKIETLQIKCDLLRVKHSSNRLGIGVHFKDSINKNKFFSILP